MGMGLWAWVGVAVTSLVSILGLFTYASASRLYRSIKPVPPSPQQNYNTYKCPLFKHLPQLSGKIAWLPLGNYPTPLHKISLQLPSGTKIQFTIKREDLSSPLYGGNKIRTLEHQLACAQATIQFEKAKNPLKDLRVVSFGGGGSNQTVATCVHGVRNGIKISTFFAAPEFPSKDNAMNLISCHSFPENKILGYWVDSYIATFIRAIRLIWFSEDQVQMPGGANITGTLGHVGAMLEFLSQIKEGQAKTPKNIFLPFGSGCTTAGLVVGVALAPHVHLDWNQFDITLHCVAVHQSMNKSSLVPAIAKRWISKLAYDTALLIRDLGGPDVTKSIKATMERVKIITSYAGNYGEFTPAALKAKDIFSQATWPDGEIQPWICSTFSGKASACMLDYLALHPDEAESTTLWLTKSNVQPHGPQNGVGVINAYAAKNAGLKQWMADSDIVDNSSFEHIMTKI